MKQTDNPTCFHCGSLLILVSKKKETSQDSNFPRIVLKYRCSNKECQEEIDRQTAKRLKLLKEKEATLKKRADLKLRAKNPK